MRGCATTNPPAEGSRAAELIARFSDFLAVAGPPVKRADIDAGRTRLRTPAARYHVRFLAWRTSPVALDLSEALEGLRRG